MKAKNPEKSSLFSRLVNAFNAAAHPLPKNTQQLLEMLKAMKENQSIDNQTFEMFKGAMQVSQMQVREAMIPRPQMVVINGYIPIETALPIIVEAGHSRFPVTGKDSEEVIGILLAKDLLAPKLSEKPAEIRQLARPATFIPESKRLNVLLKEFRSNRNHMAIVVDEYGGVSGLITIEDVLEEIVGEIADEYDIEEEPLIKALDQNKYVIKAFTPLAEFNHFFNTQFESEDIDTIGGLVLKQLSHLPKRGESIILGPLKITVIEASRRKIHLLQVTPMPSLSSQEKNI